MDNRKVIDLILTSALATLTLILAHLGFRSNAEFETLPRWFFLGGILMTLVLPGYALAVGFLPPMNGSATLIISIGISMCLNVVGGLVLNALPGGMRVLSWATFLASITLFGSVVAAVRRLRQSAPQVSDKTPILTLRGIFAFFIAILVSVFAIYVNWLSADLAGSEFTELWAIPRTEDSPYVLEIGVNNHERDVRRYNLYVESEGKRIEAWYGVEIQSERAWTGRINFQDLPEKPIIVYLYLSETPNNVYRTVKIAPELFNLALTPTAP